MKPLATASIRLLYIATRNISQHSLTEYVQTTLRFPHTYISQPLTPVQPLPLVTRWACRSTGDGRACSVIIPQDIKMADTIDGWEARLAGDSVIVSKNIDIQR